MFNNVEASQSKSLKVLSLAVWQLNGLEVCNVNTVIVKTSKVLPNNSLIRCSLVAIWSLFGRESQLPMSI